MKNNGDGPTEMKRELGLFDATMIVAGIMIGSGIFIVSAEISREVGAPGYILLLWLITGFITMIGALSYGELAGMMPRAGGQYVYLRESYNPFTGFLYGWTVFLVVQTGTIAAVAIAFARFTGVIFPWFSSQNVLADIGFRFTSQDLLAIASVLLLTAINLRGVKSGKIVQGVFTVTKIIALIGLIVLGIGVGIKSEFWNLNMENAWNAFRTVSSPDLSKVLSVEKLSGFALLGVMGYAIVGPLFASDSWNNVTYTAGETKNPQRNIPLSLFFGTLIVTVLYILVNIAYMMLLPVHGSPEGSTAVERGMMFAPSDRVATAAAEMIFGNASVLMMALLIMVSTFGCNNGLILSGARLYYAMSRDGLFFKRAGTLNRNKVPAFALIIQCIWVCLLCLSGTYSDLIAYAIFAQMLFYILTVLGVFILRKKRPDAVRPYKAFGYPLLPALYILLASGICVSLLVYRGSTSWPGVLIVLLGIPVYFFTRGKVKE